MFHGLLNLSFWGDVVATLVLTHITIIGVTVYFHRCQAHRALDLHSGLSNFFRFWVWFTTTMSTKEWVAVHRKHHSYAETEDDPHSPQIHGISALFLKGVSMYRNETKNEDTIERFGRGTPDDTFYRRFKELGVIVCLFLDVMLFGVPGFLIWGIQMLTMPVLATGVINGIGHYWGYRNFETEDASRNVLPIGLFIGGEEFHNNHHAFAASAKLSVKWWEFDIGWMYIKLFEFFGLAKINRSVPQLHEDTAKTDVDLDTLTAFLGHRLQVMDQYWRRVVLPVYTESKEKAASTRADLFKSARKLLVQDDHLIDQAQRAQLNSLLDFDSALKTIYDFRFKLGEIWKKNAANQAELLESLKAWVQQAEATGIKALQDFAQHIRCYTSRTGAVTA